MATTLSALEPARHAYAALTSTRPDVTGVLAVLAFLAFACTFVVLDARYGIKFGKHAIETGDVLSQAAAAAGEPKRDISTTPIDASARRLHRVDPEDLRRPPIAIPTVLLALGSVGAWLGAWGLHLSGSISLMRAGCIATVAAYVAFTPFHDAAHRSVASGQGFGWVNEVVGWAAGVPLMSPLPFFRYIHLMHHRHVNVKGLDPDMWSAEGAGWQLPFRWALCTFHYLAVWRQLCAAQAHEPHVQRMYATSNAAAGVYIGVMLALGAASGMAILAIWIAPAILAQTALQYVFDYLPHRPAKVPHRKDPYRATHTIVGVFGTAAELALPFLCQNYHTIHHLYPLVPWYRYPLIWNKHKKELISLGTRVLPVFMSNAEAKRRLLELNPIVQPDE